MHGKKDKIQLIAVLPIELFELSRCVKLDAEFQPCLNRYVIRIPFLQAVQFFEILRIINICDRIQGTIPAVSFAPLDAEWIIPVPLNTVVNMVRKTHFVQSDSNPALDLCFHRFSAVIRKFTMQVIIRSHIVPFFPEAFYTVISIWFSSSPIMQLS